MAVLEWQEQTEQDDVRVVSAIAALRTSELTSDGIERAMATKYSERENTLTQCDHEYYSHAESIAQQLFAFTKANKHRINLR